MKVYSVLLMPRSFLCLSCQGFRYVAAGPMVRSSYKAGEFYMKALVEAQQKPDAKEALA